MNFLAHSVLAGEEPQIVLGSLIGDFIKGVLQPDQLPPSVLTGVRLHRRIDAFSNQLPELKRSTTRLPERLRRYAPPCIDVIADHFLAEKMQADAEQFSDYRTWLYELALGEGQLHAPSSRDFFDRAQAADLFAGYADWPVCARTVKHVCSRMPATKLGPELGDLMVRELQPQLKALRTDFDAYWPLLVEHAQAFLTTAHRNGRSS